MILKINKDNIIFQFQELTEDLKSIFSSLEVDDQYSKRMIQLPHDKIANLNVHEIKKLGLPPSYPYRLEIKTKGRPINPSFSKRSYIYQSTI